MYFQIINFVGNPGGQGSPNVGVEGMQNQESVKLKKGGIDGIYMNGLFEVSGVRASGLQVIQVVFADEADFVDGGINSPYKEHNGKPVWDDKPYYLSELVIQEEIKYGKYKWDGSNGTVWTMDEPTAVFANYSIIFETAIIAIDYMGSGQDKVLGVFRWGWVDYHF